MLGLPPPKPFEAVRHLRPVADKKGKAKVDGLRFCSTSVRAFDGGAFVCARARAYGGVPTDSTDPASKLHLLCQKPGGWANFR